MGFWGMSQAGKDAQTALKNNANWQQAQAGQAGQNSTASTASGNAKSQWGYEYWKNKAEGGFANPGTIYESGKALMPGVDDAIANRWARLAKQQTGWEQTVPKAGDIMPQINSTLDQQGGNIGTNYTDNENIIKQGTANQNYLADTAYNDNVNNINTSYDKAGSDMASAYDAMGNRIEGNYGDLIKQSDKVYGEMGANVDQWGRQIEDLKPGSEASVATTARQFAPAMAAAGGRLRRAGIDPNSIQAASVLGDVEGRRAVAMDDKAAEGQQQYINAQGQLVSAKNGVLQGGFASKAGLTTGMTDRLTGLGTERSGIETGLTLGRGSDFRGATTDNRNVKLGIEGTDRSLNLDNTNASFQAGQNLLDKRNDATLLGRDLAMSDYNTTNAMLDKQNAEDITDLGLKKDQTQMGIDQEIRNENARNTGAAAITQSAENDLNRGLQWDAASGQWIRGSNDTNQGIYSTEAANAGWGAKLIGGIAGSLVGGLASPGGAFSSWMKKRPQYGNPGMTV